MKNKPKSELESIQDQIINSPTSTTGYTELGLYLHARVDYEKAIKAYEVGLHENPNDDYLHCKLGLTYHNNGNHERAITHYQKAVSINPQNAEAQYYLGFILIQEGDTADAISSLRLAINVNPNLDPAYHYLPLALESTGSHDEAIDLLFSRLKQSYPTPSGHVIFTLGELLSRRKQYRSESCHAQACVNALLEVLNKQTIHCFGDSHRSVFNNLDHIVCHNVGSGTAYNLISTNSSTGAGNKILKAVSELNPYRHAILLVFGEIDCMEHLHKNAYRKNASPESLIEELSTRYVQFAKTLNALDFEVLIYGPAFSGVALNSYGQLLERNHLLKQFNKKLRSECQSLEKLTFASLDHLLIDSALRPRLELSRDGRHMDHFPKGSKVMQGIILSAFLAEIQRRQEFHKKDHEHLEFVARFNHAHSKPYAVMEQPRTTKDQNSSYRITETGLTLEEGSKPFKVSHSSRQTALVIDLLDHVPIDRVAFKAMPEYNAYVNPIELQIRAITIHGTEELHQQSLDINHSTSHCFEFSKTTARALILHFECEPGEDLSSSNTVLLSELSIQGPYHKLAGHQSRALLDPASAWTTMRSALM
jgi:tetratricopeptide (TPR) repeat protein